MEAYIGLIFLFVSTIPIVNGVVKGVRKKRLKVGLELGVAGFSACLLGLIVSAIITIAIFEERFIPLMSVWVISTGSICWYFIRLMNRRINKSVTIADGRMSEKQKVDKEVDRDAIAVEQEGGVFVENVGNNKDKRLSLISLLSSSIAGRNELSCKVMLVIGIVLMLGGVTLSVVQLSWKKEHMLEMASGINRDFSIRTRPVGTGSYYNRLDDSYLHLGVGLTIVGALFIVGSFIASNWQRGTSKPELAPKQTEQGTDDAMSIPKQIEQLAKLKEQGILSEAEFEEKKKELLARM